VKEDEEDLRIFLSDGRKKSKGSASTALKDNKKKAVALLSIRDGQYTEDARL